MLTPGRYLRIVACYDEVCHRTSLAMSHLDEHRPQPIDANLYARLVNDAIAKLGSAHTLAVYLYLPDKIITNWAAGRGSPSVSVFLRILDLLERAEEGARPPSES